MSDHHFDPDALPARIDALCSCLLRALFELAQADRPTHVAALARELGTSRSLIADALVRLDRAGLVRAERVRLTLRGLAVAARLPARGLRAPSLLPPPVSRPRALKIPTGLRRTGS